MSEHDDKKWPGVHSQSLFLHAFIHLEVINEASRRLKVFAMRLRQKNYRRCGFMQNVWVIMMTPGWIVCDVVMQLLTRFLCTHARAEGVLHLVVSSVAVCLIFIHFELNEDHQVSCNWRDNLAKNNLELRTKALQTLTLVMTDKSMLNKPAAFISTRVYTMIETSSSTCAFTFSSDENLRLASCIRLISADQVSFTRWPLMKITSSSRMCVQIKLQLEAPCHTAFWLGKPRRMLLMR